MRLVPVLLYMTRGALAGPTADIVSSIPGFESIFESDMAFTVYSGHLSVNLTGSGLDYDELSIHYELHTCAKGIDACPIAVWHQGGPGVKADNDQTSLDMTLDVVQRRLISTTNQGIWDWNIKRSSCASLAVPAHLGSALYGAWTEMGPFQLMAQGPVYNVENAWNNAANMLYLESPAGSFISEDDHSTSFSSCSNAGFKRVMCHWNDKTQAIAYAYTLRAFFEAFPEFSGHDLYLVGESYAGQYIPNIATFMVENPSIVGKNLSGIAVGNGCWGGTSNSVLCNGKHSERNDVQMYYGKGLISKKLYNEIRTNCNFSRETDPTVPDPNVALELAFGAKCSALLAKAEETIGNKNVYNVYDNCNLDPAVQLGNSRLASRRATMPMDTTYSAGYPWNCESDPALDRYFTRSDVLSALHLNTSTGSRFQYARSGPASVTLYPNLLQHMRVLIYNGDADLCVPYVGNEEWTTDMAAQGYAIEKKAWHPWYVNNASNYAPAGYVTTYDVLDKKYNVSGDDFAFLTIRLAGHMVPQFQPKAALDFFTRFLAGADF